MIFTVDRVVDEGIFKGGLKFVSDEAQEVLTWRRIADFLNHKADVQEAIEQGHITGSFADPTAEMAYANYKNSKS